MFFGLFKHAAWGQYVPSEKNVGSFFIMFKQLLTQALNYSIFNIYFNGFMNMLQWLELSILNVALVFESTCNALQYFL